MGLSQVPVEFEHTLTDAAPQVLRVEFALSNSFNEVIHTVRQDVRSVGILADAEQVANQNNSDSIASVLSVSELLNENERSIEERAPVKGILSWFKRAVS